MKSRGREGREGSSRGTQENQKASYADMKPLQKAWLRHKHCHLIPAAVQEHEEQHDGVSVMKFYMMIFLLCFYFSFNN